MALIKCKECGQEVSSQAKLCPHCGFKLKKSAIGIILLTIFGGFAALIVISTIAEYAATGTLSESGVHKANEILKSQIANDVTVDIDLKSEKLFEAGDYYHVCGSGIVNQPGITDHRNERFIIRVNSGNNRGMAIFDGGYDEAAKNDFQQSWDEKCK